MMKMMTRRLCLVVLSIFIPLVVFSQKKDFGIWYGVSAQHKLKGKFVIDFSTSIRTFNNASKIEEAFLEGEVAYNFSKYLSAASSYRITKNIENDNSYYFRHKVFLDLKGNLAARDFTFSCRLRFQTTTKTYIENENDKYPSYTGRIKLKAVYKTPTFPVDPYIYVESFCPLFSDKTRIIEKNRFAAGVELRITRRHSFDAEYIFQRDYLPHISDINIVSVNYNIKF
jgi:Protein of unknown function (DUF2490)